MTAEEVKSGTTTLPEKSPAQQTKVIAETQTNCLGCGKPIKKLKRYYRDGKFYCNKKCWRQAREKSKEAKA